MTAVERIRRTIESEIRRLDREIQETEAMIAREPIEDFREGMTYRVHALQEERSEIVAILERIAT